MNILQIFKFLAPSTVWLLVEGDVYTQSGKQPRGHDPLT
jgi:hypothetical protein